MVVRQGIVFALPSGWSIPASQGLLTLSSPSPGPEVEAAIGIEKLPARSAGKLRIREEIQATIGGCYPAYEVRSLLERPLSRGTCIEAELQPRRGSRLAPARLFAVLLSQHLVLFDFRRAETASPLDVTVRHIVHGVRERQVKAAAARDFAAIRRGESRLVRRALAQWQVFLSHNSADKDQVRQLRDRLFDEGIVAWFDETEVKPGERFAPTIERGLSHVDAVIVARGSDGFGEWQELEYGMALNEYVRRNRAGGRRLKIIPVALPGGPPLASWTGFLGTFNGVEFKQSLTNTGIQRLVREIVPGA